MIKNPFKITSIIEAPSSHFSANNQSLILSIFLIKNTTTIHTKKVRIKEN
jgi:hypothetical protein